MHCSGALGLPRPGIALLVFIKKSYECVGLAGLMFHLTVCVILLFFVVVGKREWCLYIDDRRVVV